MDVGIGVAIGPLNQGAVAVVDALHHAIRRLDVEAAGLAHGDATLVGASLFAGRHLGAHLIAGLETEMAFLSGQIAAWKTVGGKAGALVLAASGGLDRQRGALPVLDGPDLTDTGCIERVGLRKAEASSVKFGLRPGARGDRQAGIQQGTEQGIAGGVDGGGIPKWDFGFRLDSRQQL